MDAAGRRYELHMTASLHPAENRGYRELYAYSRQLSQHWSALAEELGDPTVGPLLERGAELGTQLVDELAPATATHGLHGKPAAQTAGASIAGSSRVRDKFLERNQAARFALEDLQHLVTLLGYLSVVSGHSGNEDLSELAGRWERKLKRLEGEVRKAVTAMGTNPTGAIEPFDDSAVGRIAHSLGFAIGTAGEWIDRQVGARRKG